VLRLRSLLPGDASPEWRSLARRIMGAGDGERLVGCLLRGALAGKEARVEPPKPLPQDSTEPAAKAGDEPARPAREPAESRYGHGDYRIANALGRVAAAPRGTASAPRRIARASAANVASDPNEARAPREPRVLRSQRLLPRRRRAMAANSGRCGARRSGARPPRALRLRRRPSRCPAKRRLPPARRQRPAPKRRRPATRRPPLVRSGSISTWVARMASQLKRSCPCWPAQACQCLPRPSTR